MNEKQDATSGSAAAATKEGDATAAAAAAPGTSAAAAAAPTTVDKDPATEKLNERFADLETLAESHKSLAQEAAQGHKGASIVLQKGVHGKFSFSPLAPQLVALSGLRLYPKAKVP